MSRTEVLRDLGDGQTAHVTNMELFFDLAYVFAFTQLSEHLYEHLGWRGGVETLILFAPLWWSWYYTAWATGRLDPDRRPVVALLGLMILGNLLMATSITKAFGPRGLTFACAYVAVQLLRGGFMVWAFGRDDPSGRNYLQVLGWSVISGVTWIVGGVLHGHDVRLIIWLVAAVMDLAAALVGFRLPGAPSISLGDWSFVGGHLAERCQLLLVIAFGESFLRIGESFAATHNTARVDAAFILGFLLTFGLWAVYFLHHADAGARTLEHARGDAARMARSAYTYAHAALVGSVIVVAVAIHLAIEQPDRHASSSFAAVCVGGPGLFMAGMALSKRWLGHGRFMPPVVGILVLAAAGAATAFGARLSELAAATAVTAVLTVWALRQPTGAEAAG